MAFTFTQRDSNSPYIEAVWKSTHTSSGFYTSAADAQIDILFLRRAGEIKVVLSGPTSRALPFAYEEGYENMGIRLGRGVHLTATSMWKIIDTSIDLPTNGQRGFWFMDKNMPFPNFDSAEAFIERLVRAGYLQRDVVVEDALNSRIMRVSERSVQRHFLRSTGLTKARISQILRAEKAAGEVSVGKLSLPGIAEDFGYADASHMSRDLKYFLGKAPSHMRAANMNTWRMALDDHSVHNYSKKPPLE